MKNLWLIRHAQSQHNVKHAYPDRKELDFINTRLSEEGIAQAKQI